MYKDYWDAKQHSEKRHPYKTDWYYIVYAQVYRKLVNMSKKYDMEELAKYVEMNSTVRRSPGRKAAMQDFLEDLKNSQENA